MWKKQHCRQKKTTGVMIEFRKKNETKQKNATLLVNNLPFKFIIDSGSSVTLIPKCLFNKITSLDPLKTTREDVNNRKIDLVDEAKATVKTNKETIDLPLFITKAQTAPLMGLDWM